MNWIYIVKQGIATLSVDCVVNAANEGLWASGDVCSAIFEAAGYENLEKVCREIGYCSPGNAVITPGFDLKANYIIHAVGPKWQGGDQNEKDLLCSCYRNAMQLAQEKGCKSIGFPLIASGNLGYPKKEAWEAALLTVDSCPGDMNVYFAVIDDAMYDLGHQIYMTLFDSPD